MNFGKAKTADSKQLDQESGLPLWQRLFTIHPNGFLPLSYNNRSGARGMTSQIDFMSKRLLNFYGTKRISSSKWNMNKVMGATVCLGLKKEKGLMDMDNSVVTVGRRG